MCLKVFCVVIGVTLLGMSGLMPKVVADDKEKDRGYVKVEMKGKLRAYRMLLFGFTAASVSEDDVDIWLDYSKNDKIKRKGIVSFDEKIVVVKGNLEFRDLRASYETARRDSREGPKRLLRGQPVIVVESIEVVK